MPSVQINSSNIGTFSFTAKLDAAARTITFDISQSTYSNMSGHGILYVLGVCFSVVDQQGVVLASMNWDNPQIPVVATTSTYVLDLSSVNFAFLFQQYSIVGAIKDADGSVYATNSVYKKICQPDNFNDNGYVDGLFQLTPDCANNTLTVKELTSFAYNNQLPVNVTKSGTLYYPTGTVSPVTFTFTPFANNYIVTGSYRINNNSIATYDLGDGIFVAITYLTNLPFDVTCSDRMADVLCCVYDIQKTKEINCQNALGVRAAQQLQDIQTSLMVGLLKEINGQDASEEAKYIRKTLNCNCGKSSLNQNELNPVNPSVYSIILNGVGGTNVPSATQSGNTKQWNIASNVYQVVKGNTGDNAFTILLDTSTQYNVKYVITFNYSVMAGYILTAIGGNNTLLTQLNSLITASTNIDLSNLNGKCVIDLSSANYFLSYLVPSSSALIKNIIIGSTTYAAPSNTSVSNTSAVNAWLNSLSLGTYESSFTTAPSGSYFNLLTTANSNNPVSVTLTINGADTVVLFQKTNTSLIAFLQAVVDYLCEITALQVALGDSLSFSYYNYNGQLVTNNYTPSSTQDSFNQGLAAAISGLTSRMNTVSGLNCTAITALFQPYPNASFGNGDSVLAVLGGNCTSASDLQIAQMVINAINKYSTVKDAFCGISCGTPATCPDVANINVAMSGSNIGVYGVTWENTTSASQTVTVSYRVHGTTIWNVSTNSLLILPNGNLSGNSPYLISGVAAGTTYDIWIQNNCGGAGFIGQITTPTGSIYTGTYLLSNALYNICGLTPVTLYSNQPFATGVTLYTDSSLTTPATGHSLVASSTGGNIFYINTSTGVVGSSTGSSCTAGTAGSYILGTTTSGICSNSSVTLYTNGEFAIGKTLYSDNALTTPVSNTYLYVVNLGDTNIYYLASGVIGSTTGGTCTIPVCISLTYSFHAGDLYLYANATQSVDNPTGVLVSFNYNIDGGANYPASISIPNGSSSGAIKIPMTSGTTVTFNSDTYTPTSSSDQTYGNCS